MERLLEFSHISACVAVVVMGLMTSPEVIAADDISVSQPPSCLSDETSSSINCSDDPLDEMSDEKRLITKLLSRYERMGRSGRPVLNATKVVTVTFGLGLIQMSLDEKEKVLTMSMWTRYFWRDEYLQWDPEMYGGVDTIRLEPTDIWIPDIMLYNTADVDVPARAALVVVRADGEVFWFPQCIFRSTCSLDVSNFPFDEQNCNMAFGSWTHSSKEVDVQMAFPTGIDLTTYQANHKDSSTWAVVNITAERGLFPSNESQPNYAVLMFEMHLRRKLVFSSYILTLPCIFLASLTLVIFWLPPDRPDRTSLGMSTFSCFMVLLLILVEAAPPTANTIPKLGVYYCFNLVVIMLSIILSSLVVNISRGPSDKLSPVPPLLAFVTLRVLSQILFVKTAQKAWRRLKKQSRKHERPNKPNHSSSCLLLCCCAKVKPHRHPNNNFLLPNNAPSVTKTTNEPTDGMGQDCEGCVRRIENVLSEQQKTERVQQQVLWQWRCVAEVLDRLFFVLYLALNSFSLLVFFPRPVYSLEYGASS